MEKELGIMRRCDGGMSVGTSGVKEHSLTRGGEIRGKKGYETPAAAREISRATLFFPSSPGDY